MIKPAAANERCWAQLREHSYLMGQMVDGETAYMTARGICSLTLRLQQHEISSIKVAKWLQEQPEVKTVYHPGITKLSGA